MKKILVALTAATLTVGSLGLGAGSASAMTSYSYHHHQHYVLACHVGYHPVKVYRNGKWVWRCYRNHHHHYVHKMY
jgi:hypothetical protein